MQEISSFSGNIKLRLPKSLHFALANQAEKEGISLNQLCLMYLSSSLSEHHLGTEQFNRRLEKMEILCGSDEEMLFKELQRLYDDVEALKPLLLKAIKEIFEKNMRSISDQMDALSYVYPIYYGKSKFPFIKIPSAKVVLQPSYYQYIEYKEIEKMVSSIPNTSVAYGDFDYYLPLDRRITNRARVMSVVINIYCPFENLFNVIQEIKEVLRETGYEKEARLLIKPCYMYVDSKYFLDKVYPGEEFLNE